MLVTTSQPVPKYGKSQRTQKLPTSLQALVSYRQNQSTKEPNGQEVAEENFLSGDWIPATQKVGGILCLSKMLTLWVEMEPSRLVSINLILLFKEQSAKETQASATVSTELSNCFVKSHQAKVANGNLKEVEPLSCGQTRSVLFQLLHEMLLLREL